MDDLGYILGVVIGGTLAFFGWTMLVAQWVATQIRGTIRDVKATPKQGGS